MRDLEPTVRDVVEAYKYSGFINDSIRERDFFLTFFVSCLLNHLESGRYSRLISAMPAATNEINVEYKNDAHKQLFENLSIQAINNSDHFELMEKQLRFLQEDNVLKGCSAHQLTIIYERVLQRLQNMNVDDRLSKKFKYQLAAPLDFSELISLLANRKSFHHAYEPFATTGESSVSYLLRNENVAITTESVMQSSQYIAHKLVLAGASQINAMYTYALSPLANVKPLNFDVAYTLFQPTETSEVAEYEKQKSYDKKFLDGRINGDTVFDKYREHGFIQHILWSLKNDGIGFVILGKGPLHRQFESDARNLLLEQNVIDAVIQLPPKLTASRPLALYLLVLKKNRADNKEIKFIDATSFYTFDGKQNKLDRLSQLAELYLNEGAESALMAKVSPGDIDENSSLLTVSTYVKTSKYIGDEIDSALLRKELSRQQRLTDHILSELKKLSP